MNESNNKLLARVVVTIPSHQEEAKSVAEIATHVSSEEEIQLDLAMGATQSIISLFETLDLLSWSGNKVRIRGQIPHYFRLSLLWYIENGQKILGNWNREGAAIDIPVSDLLNRSPYLLKAMEERRRQLGFKLGMTPTPTRVQGVSIVLIKANIYGKAYFLNHWDEQARQYQLIGGKKRDSETALEAAKREFMEDIHFIEEVHHQGLLYGRDYVFNLMEGSPIEEIAISRTYGSLTKYDLYVYLAAFHLKTKSLKLGISDKWISLEEMKAGKCKSGLDVASFYRVINDKNPGLFERMPFSMEEKTTFVDRMLHSIEMKPKIFGIEIDVKRLFMRHQD